MNSVITEENHFFEDVENKVATCHEFKDDYLYIYDEFNNIVNAYDVILSEMKAYVSLCDSCKDVTVHIETENINTEKNTIHLCMNCYCESI